MADAFYDATKLHPGEVTGTLKKTTKIGGVINYYQSGRGSVPHYRIDLYTGDNRTIRVYVKDDDLNVINLTGSTSVMTLKETKDDTVAVLTVAGVLGAADEGEIFFNFVPADTSSLTSGQYVFDVEVTLSDGKKYTVVEGIVNLLQTVA